MTEYERAQPGPGLLRSSRAGRVYDIAVPSRTSDTALILTLSPWLGLQVVQCLDKAGIEVHVISGKPLSMVRMSRHCHKFTSYDAGELRSGSAAFFAYLNSYCRKHNIGVVMAADLVCTELLAANRTRIVEAAVFPVPDRALLARLHNKWTFSQYLSERQLPQPKTLLLEDASQIDEIILDFPVVAKPCAGEDGVGVYTIASKSDLRAHLRSGRPGCTLPLLVQERIDGYDIDLSILADHGRVVAWTVQRRHLDGTMEFLRNEGIVDLGRAIVAGCGYHGLAHLDMRCDNRSGAIKVLELNPRFWGSLCYSQWAGVNFPELAYRLARNELAGDAISGPEAKLVQTGLSPKGLVAAFKSRLIDLGIPLQRNARACSKFSDPLPHIWTWLTGAPLRANPDGVGRST